MHKTTEYQRGYEDGKDEGMKATAVVILFLVFVFSLGAWIF